MPVVRFQKTREDTERMGVFIAALVREGVTVRVSDYVDHWDVSVEP